MQVCRVGINCLIDLNIQGPYAEETKIICRHVREGWPGDTCLFVAHWSSLPLLKPHHPSSQVKNIYAYGALHQKVLSTLLSSKFMPKLPLK